MKQTKNNKQKFNTIQIEPSVKRKIDRIAKKTGLKLYKLVEIMVDEFDEVYNDIERNTGQK